MKVGQDEAHSSDEQEDVEADLFTFVEEENRWEFLGTGLVSCSYQQEYAGYCLCVHDGHDSKPLVCSVIMPDALFEKECTKTFALFWLDAKRFMSLQFYTTQGFAVIWGKIHALLQAQELIKGKRASPTKLRKKSKHKGKTTKAKKKEKKNSENKIDLQPKGKEPKKKSREKRAQDLPIPMVPHSIGEEQSITAARSTKRGKQKQSKVTAAASISSQPPSIPNTQESILDPKESLPEGSRVSNTQPVSKSTTTTEEESKGEEAQPPTATVSDEGGEILKRENSAKPVNNSATVNVVTPKKTLKDSDARTPTLPDSPTTSPSVGLSPTKRHASPQTNNHQRQLLTSSQPGHFDFRSVLKRTVTPSSHGTGQGGGSTIIDFRSVLRRRSQKDTSTLRASSSAPPPIHEGGQPATTQSATDNTSATTKEQPIIREEKQEKAKGTKTEEPAGKEKTEPTKSAEPERAVTEAATKSLPEGREDLQMSIKPASPREQQQTKGERRVAISRESEQPRGASKRKLNDGQIAVTEEHNKSTRSLASPRGVLSSHPEPSSTLASPHPSEIVPPPEVPVQVGDESKSYSSRSMDRYALQVIDSENKKGSARRDAAKSRSTPRDTRKRHPERDSKDLSSDKSTASPRRSNDAKKQESETSGAKRSIPTGSRERRDFDGDSKAKYDYTAEEAIQKLKDLEKKYAKVRQHVRELKEKDRQHAIERKKLLAFVHQVLASVDNLATELHIPLK